MLVIARIAEQPVELGLEPADIVLVALTLLLLQINFARGESNLMKGLLHLVLFAGYLVFVFV